MTTRRLMAIVAILAVLIWLTIPAVRIGLDRGLLRHDHVVAGPEEQVVNISIKPPLLVPAMSWSGREVTVSHSTSFARRYRAMLVGRRWSDETACGLGQVISIESLGDESSPTLPDHITVLTSGTFTTASASRNPAGPSSVIVPRKGLGQ